MTYRALLIVVGVSALALAGLALVYTVRAVVRRARAGRRRVWRGLWFRGALIAGLLAVGVASLENLPPPQMVSHPAPAAADATIAFLKTGREGTAQTVVGVSARDGATRWTREFDGMVGSLLRPTPDIIIALTSYQRVTALRATDGAILWSHTSSPYPNSQLVAGDSARVVMLELPASGTQTSYAIALDLATGAQAWRVPLPSTIWRPQALAVGDGLVFVAGVGTSAGNTPTPWAVVALGAANGALRWARVGAVGAGAFSQIRAIFALRGYAILVPEVGFVAALRERDGLTAWVATPNVEEPDNPPQINAATTDSDTLYIVSQTSRWATGANGRPIPPPVSMTALAVGGTIRWRVTLPSGGGSTLAISDGVLLSGMSVTSFRAYGGYSPNGSLLTAYDATSGRPLWRDNTPPTGMSWDMTPEISPWGGSGVAYLLGAQADPYVQDRFQCVLFCPGVTWLYAVNIHTGAPWWRVRAGYGDITRPFFVF